MEQNAYAPMRKRPLDFEGIQSSAFSVQMNGEKGWNEVGTVGANYLLLENEHVRDAAHEVASECSIDFQPNKTFFNGKNYVYSMISDKVVGEVSEGDDIALGMQFYNSYDGSKAFGFSMMLYRLVCTNGMMSKIFFNQFRFKHEPGSENWRENLNTAVDNINALSNGSKNLENMMRNLRQLNSFHIDTEALGNVRHKYLQDIPVGLWGSIVDKFTKPNYGASGFNDNEYTGWGLLNSATNLLWHKENPTVASYNHNQIIVDGLCKAIA